MANPLSLFLDNLHMTDNVLAAANDFDVEKVVSCMAICVYPGETPYPRDESMVSDLHGEHIMGVNFSVSIFSHMH